MAKKICFTIGPVSYRVEMAKLAKLRPQQVLLKQGKHAPSGREGGSVWENRADAEWWLAAKGLAGYELFGVKIRWPEDTCAPLKQPIIEGTVPYRELLVSPVIIPLEDIFPDYIPLTVDVTAEPAKKVREHKSRSDVVFIKKGE